MSTHIKSLLKPFIQANVDWKLTLLNQWEAIMGKLAQHATIEKIHDDTIIIGVYDSSWLQELYLLSPTLLHTINQHLDRPRLKQIRFKQTMRSTKKESTPKEEPTKIKKEVRLNATEETALERIQDPALQKALKSFLVRCHQERK